MDKFINSFKKLEEAGYVNVRKEFVNKKPRTILSLTTEGRQAFLQYKQNINDVLHEVK
ncbi:transcriptional regulator [Bacillus sp. 2205SS5-2]|uniref:transcriptional regulator n=1 Tax=Bacillus sp. 2205SS5-2 TaxID=3109031 RepID=UPI003FA5F4B9